MKYRTPADQSYAIVVETAALPGYISYNQTVFVLPEKIGRTHDTIVVLRVYDFVLRFLNRRVAPKYFEGFRPGRVVLDNDVVKG